MRENLKKERKKQKLTQIQLAEKLNITERQYSRLEAGTSDGSVKVWELLSEMTGKSINYLLEQVVNTKEPDRSQAEKRN